MAETLAHHLLSQLPMPLSFFSNQIAAVATSIFQFTLPFISAVTNRPPQSKNGEGHDQASTVSPELLNAALLLFIFWISLQIIGMASRYMYRMVMTMIKIGLFIVFSVIGFSIMNRGLLATQADIMFFIQTVREEWYVAFENERHRQGLRSQDP